MRKLILTGIFLLGSLGAFADEAKVYKWVDEHGVTHYGDSIPAKYAELPKEVLNEHGITVDNLEGKKSAEQIEAERVAEERRLAQILQQRADQALLATYSTIDEILMHRNRRVELFQAQSRVTELYLSNLERRLAKLHVEASNFQPYSDDPNSPMIGDDLADDLRVTKDTINRHEDNLKKFQNDEQEIIERFDGDISRFKTLKGID